MRSLDQKVGCRPNCPPRGHPGLRAIVRKVELAPAELRSDSGQSNVRWEGRRRPFEFEFDDEFEDEFDEEDASESGFDARASSASSERSGVRAEARGYGARRLWPGHSPPKTVPWSVR